MLPETNRLELLQAISSADTLKCASRQRRESKTNRHTRQNGCTALEARENQTTPKRTGAKTSTQRQPNQGLAIGKPTSSHTPQQRKHPNIEKRKTNADGMTHFTPPALGLLGLRAPSVALAEGASPKMDRNSSAGVGEGAVPGLFKASPAKGVYSVVSCWWMVWVAIGGGGGKQNGRGVTGGGRGGGVSVVDCRSG